VWCGVVCCGVVKCDLVYCVVVWCMLCGVFWCGVRCGVCCMVFGVLRCGMLWSKNYRIARKNKDILTLTRAPKCWLDVPISIEFCMSSLLDAKGKIACHGNSLVDYYLSVVEFDELLAVSLE
jgi:hypothetical protein